MQANVNGRGGGVSREGVATYCGEEVANPACGCVLARVGGERPSTNRQGGDQRVEVTGLRSGVKRAVRRRQARKREQQAVNGRRVRDQEGEGGDGMGDGPRPKSPPHGAEQVGKGRPAKEKTKEEVAVSRGAMEAV